MSPNSEWQGLGWRHPLWDLLRYYRSLSERQRQLLLRDLDASGAVTVDQSDLFSVDRTTVELLKKYLAECPGDLTGALARLRDETAALAFCRYLGVDVAYTRTQSKDHHQSSKSLVAAVSAIAIQAAADFGLECNVNPQTRAVWCSANALHVSARNLDGAISQLANPTVIWEIKEYWGKTSGGSKMSDAVYECQLVGRELREFEERCQHAMEVAHVVFLDGRNQWASRKSDLVRFIDLFHQGLIDYLCVGTDVETEWDRYLRGFLQTQLPG